MFTMLTVADFLLEDKSLTRPTGLLSTGVRRRSDASVVLSCLIHVYMPNLVCPSVGHVWPKPSHAALATDPESVFPGGFQRVCRLCRAYKQRQDVFWFPVFRHLTFAKLFQHAVLLLGSVI